MRVFESTGTGDLFMGEARMEDQPVNLPVELSVAMALGLGLEIDATEATRDELRNTGLDERTDIELRAFNAKSVPVTLEVLQYGGYRPNARISKSSQRVRRKYGDFVWRLRVPANGSKTLIYRFEQPKDADSEPAK